MHFIKTLNMKYFLWFCIATILFLISFSTYGNAISIEKNINGNPKKIYRKTIRQINNGKLAEAKKNLNLLLSDFPKNVEYNAQMALLLFWDMGDYLSSIKYFENILEYSDDSELKSEVKIFLAKCYQFDNQFEKSTEMYNQFIVEHPKDKAMIKVASKAIKDNKNAINYLKNVPKNFAMIKHFGKRINSRFPDYVPVLANQDSSLLFTSRRPIKETENSDYEAFDYPENILISKKRDNGFEKAQIYTPEEFLKNFYKKPYQNHSIVNISYDGKKIILYSKNKLWLSEKINGKWEKPSIFNKKINFSYYQPHASLSNSGDTIYFTSISKKGGIGGRDIYFSVKDKSNEWSNPTLVPNINTSFDEDSPEITKDGKKLYFSSKGWEGIGGYDIYVSKKSNGVWQKPKNLGIPLNSSGDDIFYKPSQDNKTAFFSSWRKGGIGNMDIYEAINQAQFDDCIPLNSALKSPLIIDCPDTTYLGKSIKIKSDFTKIPNLKTIKTFWSFNDKDINDSLIANHSFVDLGKNNVKLEIFTFDTIENISKNFCVSKDIFVTKAENIIASNNVNNSDSSLNNISTITDSTNIKLKQKSLTVYFDFDVKNFKSSMYNIVDDFINNNNISSYKIKIFAYADTIGNSTYNLALSERRANNVKKFLIKKGINPAQIIETTGKGESIEITDKSLLINNKFANTINDLNRRAEIIFIK